MGKEQEGQKAFWRGGHPYLHIPYRYVLGRETYAWLGCHLLALWCGQLAVTVHGSMGAVGPEMVVGRNPLCFVARERSADALIITWRAGRCLAGTYLYM